MNAVVDNTPYVALIDDDAHSARLLTRMLLAHGSPRIECFSGPQEGMSGLTAALARTSWPDMVIVDLKAHSDANLEFVTAIAPAISKLDIPIAVVAQFAGRETSEALHNAGAAAVFSRHADIDAYRREAANIVSFWVRSQRLDAVGM